MKFILIACFCLAAFYTNAQFKTPASRFKFENGLIDRGNSYRPGLFAMPSQPQATAIATNQFGKIYSPPKRQDALLCTRCKPYRNHAKCKEILRQFFDAESL